MGLSSASAPFQMSGVLFSSNIMWPICKPKQFDFASIRDGLSNTLMASEVIQCRPWAGGADLRGYIWWAQSALFETYLAPNTTQPDVYLNADWCDTSGTDQPPCVTPSSPSQPETNAARSAHAGGVQAAMCDGSVTFINDNIDLATWRALGTSQGAEVVTLP